MNDTFLVDSLTLQSPSFSDINFSKIPLYLFINNLDIHSIASGDRVNLEAVFLRNEGLFRDISVNIDPVKFHETNPWTATDVIANADKIDIMVPIKKQSIILNVATKKIENVRQFIQLSEF